jgi:hypothetical protein
MAPTLQKIKLFRWLPTPTSGTLSIFGGMLCSVVLGMWLLSSSFFIKKIHFEGNDRVSERALHHLSDIHVKSHVFSLLRYSRIQDIESQIETHPWIKTAQVKHSFFDILYGLLAAGNFQLEIEIEEQKILMLVALNHVWYANDGGDIFRQASTNDINYPVLTGIPNTWPIEHSYVTQRIIQDASKILIETSVPLLGGQNNISEIHFDKQIGFSLHLRNGTEIVLGFYDPDSRLQRLEKMLLHNPELLQTPHKIELDAEKIAITTPLQK